MRELLLKTDEKLVIREAVREDAARVIRYIKKVADETDFLSFGGNEFNISVEEEEQVFENHRKADNQIYILAEINGEIVGALNVSASHKKRLRHIGVFAVTVVRKHWRKGIGAALIEYMIDWAKHTKIIRKLNLLVNTNNERAVNLYKKYGFEVEGLDRRAFYIKDQFYDCYMMGLLID